MAQGYTVKTIWPKGSRAVGKKDLFGDRRTHEETPKPFSSQLHITMDLLPY